MKYSRINLGQIEAILNKLGGMKGVEALIAGECEVRKRMPASTYTIPVPLINTVSFFSCNAWVETLKLIARRTNAKFGKSTRVVVEVRDLYFSKFFSDGAFCGFDKAKKLLAPFGKTTFEIIERNDRNDEPNLSLMLEGTDLKLRLYDYRGTICLNWNGSDASHIRDVERNRFNAPQTWVTTLKQFAHLIDVFETLLMGHGAMHQCRAFMTVRFLEPELEQSIEVNVLLEDIPMFDDVAPQRSRKGVVWSAPHIECVITNLPNPS